MAFAGSAHHSLSELIQWWPMPRTNPDQLSANLMRLMGSAQSLIGTTQTGTGTNRGWGEKSLVKVVRELSERSWSL